VAFCRLKGGVEMLVLRADPGSDGEMSMLVGRMLLHDGYAYASGSRTYRGVEITCYDGPDPQRHIYQGRLSEEWFFAVLSTDPADGDAVVDRCLGARSLTMASRLDAFDLDIEHASAVAFADLAFLAETRGVRRQIEADADIPEPIRRHLVSLVDGAAALGAVLNVNREGVSVDTELAFDEARLTPAVRTVLSAMGPALVGARLIPEDSAAGVAWSLDMGRVVAALEGQLAERPQVRTFLEGASNVWFGGKDALSVVIPAFGPDVVLYMLPPGDGLPDAGLYVRIQSPAVAADVNSIFRSLAGVLMLAEASEKADSIPRAGRETIAGHEVFYIAPTGMGAYAEGAKIYLGVVNGWAVVSTTEEGVLRAAEFDPDAQSDPVQGGLLAQVDVARLLDLAAWFSASGRAPEVMNAARYKLAREFFLPFEPIRLLVGASPSRVTCSLRVRVKVGLLSADVRTTKGNQP
jgi:hypothetical protein